MLEIVTIGTSFLWVTQRTCPKQPRARRSFGCQFSFGFSAAPSRPLSGGTGRDSCRCDPAIPRRRDDPGTLERRPERGPLQRHGSSQATLESSCARVAVEHGRASTAAPPVPLSASPAGAERAHARPGNSD